MGWLSHALPLLSEGEGPEYNSEFVCDFWLEGSKHAVISLAASIQTLPFLHCPQLTSVK